MEMRAKSGAGQERKLEQMNEETIITFIKEINRILKPSKYLFLWVDKFHLVEGVKPLDMITWDKQKIGMGYRTRRKSEYLLILQKEPIKAKATWSLHDITDVWSEKVDKTHPHQKPLELQKKLILATTKEGDLVCDPASGSFSVLKVCELTRRTFIGGDINVDRKD